MHLIIRSQELPPLSLLQLRFLRTLPTTCSRQLVPPGVGSPFRLPLPYHHSDSEEGGWLFLIEDSYFQRLSLLQISPVSHSEETFCILQCVSLTSSLLSLDLLLISASQPVVSTESSLPLQLPVQTSSNREKGTGGGLLLLLFLSLAWPVQSSSIRSSLLQFPR